MHVGEVEASVDAQGNFVAENVQLVEGANSIVVEAIAPNGKSIQQMLELTYEPPQEPLALTITEPEQGSTVYHANGHHEGHRRRTRGHDGARRRDRGERRCGG